MLKKKQAFASMRLQAGFGKNRQTQLLKNEDMTNVIYAYGEVDEAVGRLSKTEIDFLNGKNATIYKIDNGTHTSMFYSPHKEKLIALLLQ